MTAPQARDAAQLARLSRIEGQLRGVRTMISSGRYCLDIGGQIEAVIGALRSVKSELLRDLVRACALEAHRRGDPTPMWQCLTGLFPGSAVAESPLRATSGESVRCCDESSGSRKTARRHADEPPTLTQMQQVQH
jgi:DNA-binding FrmR family transcriptional regulator